MIDSVNRGAFDPSRPLIGAFYISGQLYVPGSAPGAGQMSIERNFVPSPTGEKAVSPTFWAQEIANTWDDGINIGVRADGSPWTLRPGLHVLFGMPGSGKTVTAARIIDSVNTAEGGGAYSVDFGEPRATAFGSVADLAREIERKVRVDENNLAPSVLVIDSFKTFLYRDVGGTAAGARGTSATLGEDLATLNTQCWRGGLALIVVMNPATMNDEVVSILLTSLGAGVESVINVRDARRIDGVLVSDRVDRAYVSVQSSSNLVAAIPTRSNAPLQLEGQGGVFTSVVQADEPVDDPHRPAPQRLTFDY